MGVGGVNNTGTQMSDQDGKTGEKVKNLRILVADDHPLIRVGLWHILRQLCENLDLVEVETLDDTLAALTEDEPFDLVLLDLLMPGMSGYVSLQQICERVSGTPVIVISVKERSDDVTRAIRAGAVGYIPKSMSPDKLLSALRLILAGGVYLPQRLVGGGESIDDRQGGGLRQVAGAEGRLSQLTPRQREVLTLLAEGKSNKEIAGELGLAAGTVKIHVSSILKVLNVSNRTLAVIAANETRTW